MSHPGKFADGQPCWMDIPAPDAEKRVALCGFLTALFGWEFEVGGEDTGYYSMAHSNGKQVAAVMEMSGVPSNWTTYLATADVKASVAAVINHGGTLINGPMQVMDAGDMAIIQDSVGAVVGLWQANKMTGFGSYDEFNSLTWFDHQSEDPKKAASFFHEVFGLKVIPTADSDNAMLGSGEHTWFSVSPKQPNVPPCWNPVVQVDSLSRVTGELQKLGATILMNDMDVPGGKILVLADPVVHAPLICFEFAG
jgi:predicted enzyme related to lactoylglutathione lyase